MNLRSMYLLYKLQGAVMCTANYPLLTGGSSVTFVTTLHTRPPLLVGNADNGRLDLVRVFPFELEELGLLGRVGHLGQQIVKDLHGRMLADVCPKEKWYCNAYIS